MTNFLVFADNEKEKKNKDSSCCCLLFKAAAAADQAGESKKKKKRKAFKKKMDSKMNARERDGQSEPSTFRDDLWGGGESLGNSL